MRLRRGPGRFSRRMNLSARTKADEKGEAFISGLLLAKKGDAS